MLNPYQPQQSDKAWAVFSSKVVYALENADLGVIERRRPNKGKVRALLHAVEVDYITKTVKHS